MTVYIWCLLVLITVIIIFKRFFLLVWHNIPILLCVYSYVTTGDGITGSLNMSLWDYLQGINQ